MLINEGCYYILKRVLRCDWKLDWFPSILAFSFHFKLYELNTHIYQTSFFKVSPLKSDGDFPLTHRPFHHWVPITKYFSVWRTSAVYRHTSRASSPTQPRLPTQSTYPQSTSRLHRTELSNFLLEFLKGERKTWCKTTACSIITLSIFLISDLRQATCPRPTTLPIQKEGLLYCHVIVQKMQQYEPFLQSKGQTFLCNVLDKQMKNNT